MIEVATVLGKALFDDEDWNIAYHKWGQKHGHLFGRYKGRLCFAHTLVGEKHGLIGRLDHKDTNKINNQFCNLREATHSQNGANRDKQVNNTSGCKGVSLDKRTGKWRAFIHINGVRNHIGNYIYKDNADAAYKAEAIKQFGEFAFKGAKDVN